MKAIIVTTQYVNNYGAVLQAVGLHCFLNKHSWSHEFLNQVSKDSKIFDSIFPLRKESVYYAITNIRKLSQVRNLKKRLKRFEEFRQQYIPQTKQYGTQQQIINDNLNYDLYITGGDQMWNRSCLNRPVNLLQFGNEDSPRISYSTSMGSAVFSGEEYNQLYNALNKYQEISVREHSACDTLSSTLATTVRQDIDGSFLLSSDEWNEMSIFDDKKYPSEYILVYELLQHPDLEKAVDAMKERCKLPVVLLTVNAKPSIKADYIVRDAGPAEFLGFFSNATAVATTSFHGTCFSVIYRKPFVSLVRENEQRINHILDRFHLTDNYFYHFTEMKSDKIDFSQATSEIELGQQKAEAYLRRYFDEQ